MNDTDVAVICKALSDSNRLRIVRLLTDGPLCGCKILESLAITQPTLSHHMKVLVECGLVRAEKNGRWSIYSLDCTALGAFREYVGALACADGCTADGADGCAAKGGC